MANSGFSFFTGPPSLQLIKVTTYFTDQTNYRKPPQTKRGELARFLLRRARFFLTLARLASTSLLETFTSLPNSEMKFCIASV